MSPFRTGVGATALVIAVLSVLATALTLVLVLDLAGAPPNIPASADFPTRILEGQAFERSRWPIDFASSLLFTGAFGAVILLGALLSSRTGRSAIGALLGAGGLLGIASQLTHVGAHQVAVSIGYCDCGFKTEEAISQAWALMVSDGIADWLLIAALVLLAAGVIAAAGVIVREGMPAVWGTLSYGLAGVLGLGAALTILGVDGPWASLLIALGSGVLLPVWAVWLAVGSRDRPATEGRPAAGA